jgi:hypothetical protein
LPLLGDSNVTAPRNWDTIKRSLQARGLWNEDGVSRKAKARFCRKCSAPVIAGLDHDRSAAAVHCDPQPLNVLGEAVALMTGRRTFSLRWLGGHYELDVRFAEHISGSPAGSQPGIDILASHLCNSPDLPVHMHGQPTSRPATPTFGDDLDQPPF